MTVAELIKDLSTMPQDRTVHVHSGNGDLEEATEVLLASHAPIVVIW